MLIPAKHKLVFGDFCTVKISGAEAYDFYGEKGGLTFRLEPLRNTKFAFSLTSRPKGTVYEPKGSPDIPKGTVSEPKGSLYEHLGTEN